MQIGEATKQETATRTERDERNSSMAGLGAEIGTAAHGRTKAEGLRQMDAVVERSNLWRAYERVMRNKGAAGVDGLTVFEFKAWLQQHWPSVKAALLAGDYLPAAIRKVDIPKPNGGVRTLGIPTVLDRLIQQALLQVLQPEFEPEFSEHSYGFRPGRNAWQAVQRAQGYIGEGRRWVVDLDLEKFFDRVNHPAAAFPDVALCSLHRLPRIASRSKPVAMLGECGLEFWLQNLQQRLLDQTIQYRRDAQCA